MTDEELDAWIRRSHTHPDLPPSFSREVWSRIAQAETRATLPHHLHPLRLLELLSHPLPALLAVTLMLLLGAGTGAWVATRNSSPSHRADYLASIDPLSPTRTASTE